MRKAANKSLTTGPQALLGVLAAALFCLGLFAASPAFAAYEQIGCFAGTLPGLPDSCKPIAEEKFGEEVQLGGVGGMAVNYTGAGGVDPGTVYAASYTNDTGFHIAMYEPQSGGGLKFSQRWAVNNFDEAVEKPYERCGPTLGTECKPIVKAGLGWVDVEVDQTTGNVYTHNGEGIQAGEKKIVVYNADGSEVITRFGEKVPKPEPTEEHPEKMHGLSASGSNLAVDGSGVVYLYDANNLFGFYERLMVFKPQSPGDYEHYVYAGEVLPNSAAPQYPALDTDGHIYTAAPSNGQISMYAPQTPAPYPAPAATTPICTYKFTKAGIASLTVNPTTGEVFFYSYKLPKRVRRLGPCDPQTGKFTELEPEPEALTVTPEREDVTALAFDPVRQVDPQRPPGVLYGGTPTPTDGQGSGEPGQSSLGYIFARSKEVPPEVESQSVTHVTASGALLHAAIDPHGFNTEYAFQYIPLAQYEANPPEDRFAGASEAPIGGATIPAAQGGQDVSAAIAGLAPGTDYRFRVVAISHCSPSEAEKECEDAGEAESFRTFLLEVPGLPDRRAYELVSPAQKNGGQVMPADTNISSCVKGECKPGDNYSQFPRQSTPDGDAIAYEGTPFGSEGALIENQYIARRDKDTGWQTVNLSPSLGRPAYQAFDKELSQGLLRQGSPALSPQAPPEYPNLYAQPTADPLAPMPALTGQPPNRSAIGGASVEFQLAYAGASADLSRVFFKANDALTEETPLAPAAVDGGVDKFNLYEWERTTGELRLVNVLPGNSASEPGASFGVSSAHTVSEDGSRAFWSDGTGRLYVREDTKVTREIPDSGKFLGASADGSKVLLDNGHLYDLEEEATTDLTAGKGGFQGAVGQRDDLSRVYFVDTAVLDEAPNQEGDEAEAGKLNLYAWNEGASRYLATLVAEDNDGSSLGADWQPSPAARTAQASPNGRFLAFLSRARLTGYDNTVAGGGAASEVFLYDSQSDELICPSCNPSGTRPLGFSALRRIKGGGALSQPRYLSDEGRLLFDSRDSLSVFDTNEGVEDVYEYEPDKVGTCKRAEGCVSLISPGSGSYDSNLVTVDEDGKNVFFTARDQLTLPDKDELYDLYVAREDGGIPGETAKADSECQGEACQPAAIAPNDPTPASAGFEGDGNVKSNSSKPRCPKGRRQVKRKGKTRCVKRSAKHAKRHSARAANRNRGGAK
jgi:hypothetical protein